MVLDRSSWVMPPSWSAVAVWQVAEGVSASRMAASTASVRLHRLGVTAAGCGLALGVGVCKAGRLVPWPAETCGLAESICCFPEAGKGRRLVKTKTGTDRTHRVEVFITPRF